ncbi:MAG: hypothetical protein HZC49_08065 [Nitrospirae bacterium]|nr:hypothetical protein [Nitrospirota bacterium]
MESADFELPYEKLTEKYNEIPVYEKQCRGFSINTPLAVDLIAVWGDPDIIETEWYYYPLIGGELVALGVLMNTGPVPPLVAGGLALLIRPLPSETYIWQKGNYCIETYIDTAFPIYKKTIISWEWTDIHVDEKISKACKQVQHNKLEPADKLTVR